MPRFESGIKLFFVPIIAHMALALQFPTFWNKSFYDLKNWQKSFEFEDITINILNTGFKSNQACIETFLLKHTKNFFLTLRLTLLHNRKLKTTKTKENQVHELLAKTKHYCFFFSWSGSSRAFSSLGGALRGDLGISRGSRNGAMNRQPRNTTKPM